MARSSRQPGNSVNALLEPYLREINQIPLLTPEEEKELAYRIGRSDSAARDQMVRSNLRLVVNIARSFTGRGLDLQDLIEEGNLGLMRAVEGFDPTMNTRFSTYASFWIKQSIKRALVNSAKTIRLPAHVVDLLAKWRRTTAELQDELGRLPTTEETARRLKLSKKRVRNLLQSLRLSEGVPRAYSGGQGPSLEEVLLDDRGRTAEHATIQAEHRQQLLQQIDRMSAREAAVLRMRFGLDSGAPMTFQEIGGKLGVTRERVRQIESEALAKLSQRLLAE